MVYRPTLLNLPPFYPEGHWPHFRFEPKTEEDLPTEISFPVKITSTVNALFLFLQTEAFDTTSLQESLVISLQPLQALENAPATLQKIYSVFRHFLDNLKKFLTHEQFEQMQNLLNHLQATGCSFLHTLQQIQLILSENKEESIRQKKLEAFAQDLLSQKRFAESAEVISRLTIHKDLFLQKLALKLMDEEQISDALYIAKTLLDPSIQNATFQELGLFLIGQNRLSEGAYFFSHMEEKSQTLAFQESANLLLQMKKIESALHMTDFITDSITKDEVFKTIALQLLKEDERDRACEIGMKIKDEEIKSSLFEEIALFFIQKKQLQKALPMAHAIPLLPYRDRTFTQISWWLEHRDQLLEAKMVVLLISETLARNLALSQIVLKLTKKKDFDNAAAFFDLISQKARPIFLKTIAQSLIEEGLLQEADAFVDVLSDKEAKDFVYKEIPLLRPTHNSLEFVECISSFSGCFLLPVLPPPPPKEFE